jgi:hypothetical protein
VSNTTRLTKGKTMETIPNYLGLEYSSYANMKSRCYNPNSTGYHGYGGRGIKICDRWLESFDNFLTDMGPIPDSDYSIDRINVNGNYEPSNCRWTTNRIQSLNRRDTVAVKVTDPELINEALNFNINRYGNKTFTYNNKEYSATELAALSKLPDYIVINRLYEDWKPEHAIMQPVSENDKFNIYHSYLTLKEISEITNIPYHKLYNQVVNRSLPVDIAIKYLTHGKIDSSNGAMLFRTNNWYKLYEYKGSWYTVRGLMPFSKVPYSVLVDRLFQNFTTEDALTLPVKVIKLHNYQNENLNLKQIASREGISSNALTKRVLRLGSLDKALSLEGPVTYAYNGKQMTVREISELTGLAIPLIYKRLSKGLTIEEAVTFEPIKKYPYKGEMLSVTEIAEITGFNKSTILRKIKKNVPLF